MCNYDTPPQTPNPFDSEDSDEEFSEMYEIRDEDIMIDSDENLEDDQSLDEHFNALNDAVNNGMDALEEEMGMEEQPSYPLDKPYFEFSKHKDSVFTCDIDKQSGNLIATGGQDDTAYVWNTNNGEVCLVCEGHTDSVTQVKFSSDCKYLATADMAGTVFVWSASTLTKVMEQKVEDIMWISWHNKANVLFVGTEGAGLVYFWEISSQKLKVIPGPGFDCSAGVILPDGLRIALGYDDNTSKVVNLKDLTVQHTIKTPSAPAASRSNNDEEEEEEERGTVICMDTHPNNNLVAYGTSKGEVVLYQSQGGKIIATFNETSSVEDIRFQKKNLELNIIVVANTKGDISIWDYAKKIVRHKVSTECGISKFIFNEDESKLLAATLDGWVCIFSLLSGTLEKKIACHYDSILDICFIPSKSAFVTTSDDHTARVFELKHGDEGS